MSGRAVRARFAPAARHSAGGPLVVKLGGSVIRSPDLASWLEAIVDARAPVVVVPGGGALADEVRACQASLGFGDGAAHRMALLAMDQLAWAVAGMRRGRGARAPMSSPAGASSMKPSRRCCAPRAFPPRFSAAATRPPSRPLPLPAPRSAP